MPITINISRLVEEYAKESGAVQVWKTWRDTMLEQGREVSSKFTRLPIPDPDMRLDARIAQDVIDDFLAWIDAHHDIQLRIW